MENLTKFSHFENLILIILQWLTQKKWYIEATMLIFNNKLQKIDLQKIPLYGLKKDLWSFYKSITY
jgi:hypothetical protein